MTLLWGIFLARLFDPVGALIALTIGAFGRSKWIILIGGVIAAAIADGLLIWMGRFEGFETGPFLAGVVAFSLWSALGHLAFRRMMGKVSE